MTERTWFLPPDFLSYQAATESNPGHIRLGQLISAIDDPGHTIGTLAPLKIDNDEMPLSEVQATGMDHEDNASSSYVANIFIKAVEVMGAKFNIKVQHSNKLLSAMEEVEAQTFEPNDDYVKKSLQQAKVQSWLKETWPRKRVFMVCGILIARPTANSKVNMSTEKSSEFSAEGEGHGTAAQAPISGGAGAGGTFAKNFGLAFVPKTPFIYGFRLRECFLKRKQSSSKLHTKGAKMHANSDSSESKGAETEDLGFECSGIAKKDLDFESLGDAQETFEAETLADSGASMTCSLVVQKAK
jgi:hypothetical protein